MRSVKQMMRKLVGCAALLVSSAFLLPGVAAARDRNDASARYEQRDRHDSQDRLESRERVTSGRRDRDDHARDRVSYRDFDRDHRDRD